jgi:hypothetical protein
MKYLHFTIDCDFIPNSNLVFDELLMFIEHNKLRPTFFLTGNFTKEYPKLSEKLADDYEIGCHGLDHGMSLKESFDSQFSYSEKFACLKEATSLIEKNTGIKPIIFRAPNLKISEDTFSILKELDYKIDSSIPSNRFDFWAGNINNMKYLRFPYRPNYLPNGIFEIPPSALIFPLNMRFVKIFGINTLLNFINNFLADRQTLVFYLHPAELESNRNILQYPKEKEYFYKGGGMHLLKHLQLLVDLLKSKEFISTTMTNHLETIKNTGVTR